MLVAYHLPLPGYKWNNHGIQLICAMTVNSYLAYFIPEKSFCVARNAFGSSSDTDPVEER